MASFLHSGLIGDIIYSLPVIKTLGGGTLYLCNKPVTKDMTQERFDALIPLLQAQPYLEVKWHKGEKVKYDFTDFRAGILGRRSISENLALTQAHHVCPFVPPNIIDPWLEVNSGYQEHGRTVIARSARYHVPEWDKIWPEVMEMHPNAIFIGTEAEHAGFEKDLKEWGEIEHVKTCDMLEAAQIIKGAKLFIGNQSSPYAICEGLKQNSIQETNPRGPDCVYPRRNNNAYFISSYAQWEKVRDGMQPRAIRLALALQFYPGDHVAASELCELIVDIEKTYRKDIEFILLARDDVPGIDINTLAVKLSQCFDVTSIRSRRNGRGWPEGCNDLWQSGMMQIVKLKDQGKLQSEAVYTFEPDVVPMRRDWIDCLKEEWRKTQEAGKLCCGALLEKPEWHINGNAIFSIQITRKFKSLQSSGGSWDMAHRKLLCSVARPSKAFQFLYRDGSNNEESLNIISALRPNEENLVPAVLHGLKTPHGRKIIREILCQT